jgi:energy-coupling factor transport system ATP-binding protein
VVVAEHRLERFLGTASSVLAVEAGHVSKVAPRQAAARLTGVPPFVEISRRLGEAALSIEEARRTVDVSRLARRPRPAPPTPGDPVLSVRRAMVTYGAVKALDGIDLEVRQGEVVALVGANGSGKTTLLRTIAGLIRQAEGEVRLRGTVAARDVRERSAVAGLVPQDPAVALFQESVADEVAAGLRFRKRREPSPGGVLRRWGLDGVAEVNPRDLSVGQQLRVAVASMLAHEPPLWLLDEPTRGADTHAKEWLAGRIREQAACGGAAIIATHDIETAAMVATRTVGLERGRVAFDLPAREAFGAAGPRPTSLSQVVPWALTLEDIA